MEPNGVKMYVFSAGNRWVAWPGSSGGAANTQLIGNDGDPLLTIFDDEISHALDSDFENLTTASRTFVLSPTSASTEFMAVGTLDGDALANTPASGGMQAGVSSRTYGYNGATWDRIRTFASDADALAAPALGLLGTRAFLAGFNGATYDRILSYANNADALAVSTSGVLGTRAFMAGFNGATYDRLRSFATNADAVVVATLGALGVTGFSLAFNGTTFDRVRTNSAATLASATQPFAQLVASPGEWSITHTPALNVQATITRAAGAAGVRHVCRSISATCDDTLGAGATFNVLLNVRDGASGAGTIVWSRRFVLTGTGIPPIPLQLSGLNIVGSAATAMTIEFSAAGGAAVIQTVAMTGYDTI